MKKKKGFKIYLLVFGKFAYVGKTFSKRLSSVYQRHCRGDVVATRRIAQKEERPKMYLLIDEEMERYQAYRYVLAYVRMFREAGYHILNCERSVVRSEDLHIETQKLFENIQENVESLLARTYMKDIRSADEVVPDIAQAKPEKQKLTIRVDPAIKAEYMRLGQERGLSQEETLLCLVNNAKQSNLKLSNAERDACIFETLKSYKEKIEKLKKQNAELKESVKTSRADKHDKLRRKNDQFDFIKNGVLEYFKMMRSAGGIPLEIEQGFYENYPTRDQYEFPEKERFFVVRPVAILYGKGRWNARFLLGEGDDGKRYKFRMYPKNYYMGIPLNNKVFGKRNSVWLVGCEKATDGAMDLVFSFPLDICFRYNGPEEYGSEYSRFMADLEKEFQQYDD